MTWMLLIAIGGWGGVSGIDKSPGLTGEQCKQIIRELKPLRNNGLAAVCVSIKGERFGFQEVSEE